MAVNRTWIRPPGVSPLSPILTLFPPRPAADMNSKITGQVCLCLIVFVSQKWSCKTRNIKVIECDLWPLTFVSVSRWSQCLGRHSRREAQTWSEVWLTLSIHGLCLRYINGVCHRCWCCTGRWWQQWQTATVTDSYSDRQLTESFFFSFHRRTGEEVLPAVRTSCISPGRDLVKHIYTCFFTFVCVYFTQVEKR